MLVKGSAGVFNIWFGLGRVVWSTESRCRFIRDHFPSEGNSFLVICFTLRCFICYSSYINSLAPGKFEWNFWHVIFKRIIVIAGWGISCEIALIWMSTLVQVIAWCRQATSHYLSQCWPRFLSPYGVTRPQWVKGVASFCCQMFGSA